jgi:ABC-type hemin transport system ATPase subunit
MDLPAHRRAHHRRRHRRPVDQKGSRHDGTHSQGTRPGQALSARSRARQLRLRPLPGEILAVIGDNGAGKSTMIKALSGARHARFGQDLAGGQGGELPLAARRRASRHRNRLPDARHVAGPVDHRQHVHGPRDAQARLMGSVLRQLDRKAMEPSPATSSMNSG